MDNHQSGPVEMGAPMDYQEHEKTYSMFLAGAKWGTMVVVVLLIAMAAGFFGGAGIIGSLLVFLVLNAAGAFLLR
ncbi:aa3-type cytochrome c oxidase subunit IV [Rhizobium sp. NTR19]|jgi:Bacterial aa3 type cytochrome c oxidase subunit IV.|uniref:Aa3-type cytochrome c oxidase subunit IV n=1 Tax=Neorhizobium turbinariae TaxID=2937795 RepID=A0ABT0IMA1_9HYPH|nr:aa3-type cytochrome c oxidase subunit IV [Neorhizobium turbinariae]MCK8779018.1 aa3-type cytochrome c oxidase subunit IV [Neorhizobium turbinariae]